MRTRQRQLAGLVVWAGVAVTAAGLMVVRTPLEARWHVARLSSPDVEERRHAVVGLRRLKYPVAAPHLVKLVEDDADEGVRHEALRAVVACGPQVVAALLKKKFDHSKGHCPLFYALDKKDVAAVRDAVRVLLRCAGDADRLTRWKAACVLWQIGPLEGSLIPDLAAGLRDGSVHVRRLAAFALGQMGVGAESAIALLVSVERQEHEAVREAATYALGHIDKR